jgi:hypothetical protein
MMKGGWNWLKIMFSGRLCVSKVEPLGSAITELVRMVILIWFEMCDPFPVIELDVENFRPMYGSTLSCVGPIWPSSNLKQKNLPYG